MKKRKLLAAFFLLLAACVLALCIAAIRRARLLPSETGISVPIFMYHAVGNDCWGEESLFVKPEELEKQLQYLSENGYETIFFEDLAHIEQYEKPVMLTFDDGYDDNNTNLLPLLQKYGMKATIFLIAGDVGKRHKLTREQISELVQSGLVSIQATDGAIGIWRICLLWNCCWRWRAARAPLQRSPDGPPPRFPIRMEAAMSA